MRLVLASPPIPKCSHIVDHARPYALGGSADPGTCACCAEPITGSGTHGALPTK